MYRVLVVEDDESEGRNLCDLLNRYASDHSLTIQISWLKSAIEFISGNQAYDLVLLDIGLPGISGMEAAKMLRARDSVTPIIFITSLAQYAAQGYEVDALGFIVKPVTYAALSLYLGRSTSLWQKTLGRVVTLPTEEGVRVVPLRDVTYVEVKDHSLIWHFENAPSILVRGSLKEVERTLDGAPVLRVSKNALVNMDKVVSINHGVLSVTSGEEIILSRSHRRQTIGQLTSYLGSRR